MTSLLVFLIFFILAASILYWGLTKVPWAPPFVWAWQVIFAFILLLVLFMFWPGGHMGYWR